MTRALTFVSFSCACGAEVHLSENSTDATEIICLACGEWIGVHAELMPAPKKKTVKRTQRAARPKSKVRKKIGKKPPRRRG